MNSLYLKGTVRYPDYELNFDLSLPESGITALFGASGAGKSTLLRAVAGLIKPENGIIRFGETVWQDDTAGLFIPTHKRSLGFVFQDARLFSHLNVTGNIRYGMKRIRTEQRRISLERAVDLLGIGHLLDRMPDTLSGGEKQRVSIARALATSPDIMLMDEPLAALDMKRKSEILPYLQRLNEELGIPILYVSHALEEVSTLADHLVLLEQGRILATGKTGDMLTRLDLPLAYYDTASAIIEGKIIAEDTRFSLSTLSFPGGLIYLPTCNFSIGKHIRLRIQARDVSLTIQKPEQTSILNIIETTVTGLSPESKGEVMVELDANGTRLLSRITGKSASVLKLDIGKPVYAQIKGIAILESFSG